MVDVLKKEVKDLVGKKDAMEREIKELQDLLDSQKGICMKENLVDNEGYPRSDIDVYSVRFARNRIICLQNDYKTLMKEIEEGIHALHAKARELKENENSVEDGKIKDESSDKSRAFLKVDSVSEGSPSSYAGLKAGDQILKFGSITELNFQGLQDIASVVQHSKGSSISVTVERDDKSFTLLLTPNTWAGRGLLGCHIIPVK